MSMFGATPHFESGVHEPRMDIGSGIESADTFKADEGFARAQARVHLSLLLNRVNHVSELDDPYRKAPAPNGHIDKSSIPGLTGNFDDLI